MPDPDPPDREQILGEWQKAVDAAGGGGNTLDLLQALMAAGYQIVPKGPPPPPHDPGVGVYGRKA